MASTIMEKISRLLALAESDNANEAEQALLMARRLMIQHQLDEAAVRGIHVKADAVEIVKVDNMSKVRETWELCLAVAVERAFSCQSFTTAPAVHFVGVNTDAEVAAYVFANIRLRLRTLAAAATAANTKRIKAGRNPNLLLALGSPHRPRTWRRSWLMGAVAGFRMKIEASKKADSPTVTALVLSREAMVEVEINKMNLRAGRAPRPAEHRGAFDQGFRVGQTIEMQDAIATEGTKGLPGK